MGLSALIRGHRTPRQLLRIITEFDEVLILACTLAVDKTSDPTQTKSLPAPSTRTSDPVHSDPSEVQPMDLEPYGSSLLTRSTQKPQPERGVHSDLHSEHSDQASDSEYYQARPKHKKHADRKKQKPKSKPIHKKSRSSAEEDESSAQSRGSTQPQQKVPPEPYPQAISDPVFYREVDMSDVPSQYTEEIETFRQLLDLLDPRETMPRSSTSVLGLDDEKGQQEQRPRGPSAMLPLSPFIREAFEKFEQDFLASNLPEGKYIKPPASTAKYYKVGQPCFEDKLQELNSDFGKICISPKPSGAPVAKVPLHILKELDQQSRQNLSTINFLATFGRTSSACNSVLEKGLHSARSAYRKTKNQILDGADPRKLIKRGYENACENFDIMEKRILSQQRALACLSKSLSHILQRVLYTMGNTGLLRREAEMTLLHPHLGESRRQELRNSPFWPSPLFKSQLVKDGEDFLLKKSLTKTLRVLDPIKTSPFVVLTTIRKEAPTGNAPMGAIPPKAITNRFPLTEENQTSEAPGVVFDPTTGDKGVETPPHNDSSKASISPPVGGRLRSFSRDW